MYDFDYVAPTEIADAVQIYGADDAKLLAGGMTLLPTCKQRLASPSILIDLRRLDGLVGISLDKQTLRIGAMTTHAEVANSPTVRQTIPALAALAGGIGDVQVRNRGTIGGSLANNDPSADYPAAILGLGGTLVTTRRKIQADDFFVGMFETALEHGEILTAVEIPVCTTSGYASYRNRASRYAIIGVMVSTGKFGTRVAVTGAGHGVFRSADLEAALEREWSPDAVANIRLSSERCSGDMHASADYRAHLIPVMAKRAIVNSMSREQCSTNL